MDSALKDKLVAQPRPFAAGVTAKFSEDKYPYFSDISREKRQVRRYLQDQA